MQPKRDLSTAQERRLLSKHLTGDFGSGSRETVEVLIQRGFVETCGNSLVVTRKGREYCDAYHAVIKT